MKTIVARLLIAALAGIAFPVVASAQTRSIRDTATAYGARLDAKGLPADLNERRVNNRIDSRIDNRLALRIERYRPDNVANPTAAYQAQATQSDKSRIVPQIAPAPTQDDENQ